MDYTVDPKVTVPEIAWHNKQAIYGVDIQNQLLSQNGDGNKYRVATAGADTNVVIWHLLIDQEGEAKLTFASCLTRHQKTVNCVAFSPSGALLASGDDDGVLLVWTKKNEEQAESIFDDEVSGIESWMVSKILRGHLEDVYDLSWSPNSLFLASGSVDNHVIVWSINSGQVAHKFKNHDGYVQGVAWDPQNKFVASLGTDQLLCIVDPHQKQTIASFTRSKVPLDDGTFRHLLFHDDSLKSYFRRLDFSPDGSLLATPAAFFWEGKTEESEITDRSSLPSGQTSPCNGSSLRNSSPTTSAQSKIKKKNLQEKNHVVMVFSRKDLASPCALLPLKEDSAVTVAFCPRLFMLRKISSDPKDAQGNSSVKAVDATPSVSSMAELPFRAVLAVATRTSIFLYDTQQASPLSLIKEVHVETLTDLSWSADGNVLMASSVDGYCTIITFLGGCLGVKYIEGEEENTDNPSPVVLNELPSKNKGEDQGVETNSPVVIDLSSDTTVELETTVELDASGELDASMEIMDAPSSPDASVDPNASTKTIDALTMIDELYPEDAPIDCNTSGELDVSGDSDTIPASPPTTVFEESNEVITIEDSDEDIHLVYDSDEPESQAANSKEIQREGTSKVGSKEPGEQVDVAKIDAEAAASTSEDVPVDTPLLATEVVDSNVNDEEETSYVTPSKKIKLDATPEKSKGRRVRLTTLSSPKDKKKK